MTTIAYRDGTMAADTRAYAGYNAPLGSKSKLRLSEDGSLMGCSSSAPGQSDAVLAWALAGADPRSAPAFDKPNFALLIVRPDGSALYGYDSFHLSGPVSAPFYAVGSGMGYAIGAMSMGASAERAVEVACQHDVWTGAPVQAITHERNT